MTNSPPFSRQSLSASLCPAQCPVLGCSMHRQTKLPAFLEFLFEERGRGLGRQ